MAYIIQYQPYKPSMGWYTVRTNIENETEAFIALTSQIRREHGLDNDDLYDMIKADKLRFSRYKPC